MKVNDLLLFIKEILISEKYQENISSFEDRSKRKFDRKICHFLESEKNYEYITLSHGGIAFEFILRNSFIVEQNSYKLYEFNMSKNDILNFDNDILANVIKHGRFISEEVKSPSLILTLEESKSFFMDDKNDN